MLGAITAAREAIAADTPAATRARGRWLLAFLASLGLLGVFAISIGWVLIEGVGVWGNNIPVAWAFDIIGYDWWIGVATGAMLLAAGSLLCGVRWRGGGVDRIAETLAVVAAAAAAIYPILHLGRPWFFYWNLPYPNTMALWPQFRSPLAWDAMDILGYLATAVCFWFLGLVPDLAARRDRAEKRWQALGYGIAALGWRGSAVHWQRWQHARKSLAVLAVVMVVGLQTGASVMYAGTVEPGWHDTLLPLLFIATAAFSGIAATIMTVVLLRGEVMQRHLDALGRLLLAAGLLSIWCYGFDFFTTALRGNGFDLAEQARRLAGPAAWSFWTLVATALLPVQLMWFGAARRSPVVALGVALLVLVGMWCDRFMFIVGPQLHDFLPSAAGHYGESIWGIATFAGSCGLFAVLLMLATRLLPLRVGVRDA